MKYSKKLLKTILENDFQRMLEVCNKSIGLQEERIERVTLVLEKKLGKTLSKYLKERTPAMIPLFARLREVKTVKQQITNTFAMHRTLTSKKFYQRKTVVRELVRQAKECTAYISQRFHDCAFHIPSNDKALKLKSYAAANELKKLGIELCGSNITFEYDDTAMSEFFGDLISRHIKIKPCTTIQNHK